MRLKQLNAGIAEKEIAGRGAQALALSSGAGVALLVTADIRGMSVVRANAVSSKICESTGLGASGVMLVCSGSFSGPVTCPGYGLGEEDTAFLDALEAALPELADSAVKALAPASAGSYRACLPHAAHNARLLTRNYKAVNEWLSVPKNEVLSPEGPADADLDVLALRGGTGEIASLLWCYSAPDRFQESLGQAVQAEIDKRMGMHVPCLRLPGCGANTAFTYGFEKTVDLLASSVVASALEACCDPTAAVSFARREVILPVRDSSKFHDRAEVELKYPDAVKVFELELEKLQKEAAVALPAAIQALRIGNFTIAGLPGEAFAELALDLKQSPPAGRACVAGLCGGTLGVVVPERSFENGGFEAWPARWALPARGCNEFLRGELAFLMARLAAGKAAIG